MRDIRVNRRGFFSGATVALGAALPEGAEAGAATGVEDRSSRIRITDAVPHLCRDRVFLRVDTNLGISGWGEIKGVVPTVAAELARSMLTLLRGENPTRIEHLWQTLYRAERNQRGGAFMLHCIAGYDMALWDITGKLWGVPVYRLLGGAVRDKLRAYPSTTAIKVGVGVKGFGADPADIESMLEPIRKAREKVGPKGTVMFDAHSSVPPATLRQLAAGMEPYAVRFIEEPAVPGNMEVFKQLRAAIKVPLATGERDRTLWGILPYLTDGIVDFVQPDCGYTGGISQMRKIAAIAEAYYTPIVPHCTQSYLGMTASFHAAFNAPLFMIHEAYDDALWAQVIKPHWKKSADGFVTLPEGTGLCVDVDEVALKRVASDPTYRYQWRGPGRHPDGAVADY